MLAVTAIGALWLLTLAKPAEGWLWIWPFAFSGFCVFAVNKAVALRPEQAFWLSFAIGITSFVITFLSVHLIVALIGFGPLETDTLQIAAAAIWLLFRHDETKIVNPVRTVEFMSFAVSCYFFVSVIWSAILASMAQYIASRRR
jgi:hypothetical protein